MVKLHALLCSYLFLAISNVVYALQSFPANDLHFVWSFDKDNQNSLNVINTTVPESFFLTEIILDCDSVCSSEELVTLLGFDQASFITRNQLIKGLQHCGCKEKFEKISVTLQKKEDGWSLHGRFTSWWTLLKVRCKGPLFGKDRYRHSYRLRSGQYFDPIQHHEALKVIEGLLYDDGYLAPDVTDVLLYDDSYKTIDVTLYLEPGDRYTMRSVAVELYDVHDEIVHSLSAKIKRRAVRELVGNSVTKVLLQEVTHQIEELCIQEGFLQVVVAYEIVPHHQRHDAQIIFKLTLGERRRFTFFGNHFFSERQLYDRLMFFGKSISLVPPSILIEELIDLYKDHGFWKIAITVQEEHERCFFCIKEGARSSIQRVSCEGVTYFSENSFSALCSEILHSDFDKKKQRLVRESIMQAYMSAGFWDCEIVQEQFIPIDQKRNEYRYHIVIKEGAQRKLCSVMLPEFLEKSPRAQELVFNFLRGRNQPIPFDIQMINDQRRTLLEYLQNNGYLYAHPKPVLQQKIEVPEGNASAEKVSSEVALMTVNWQVDNSSKVYFGDAIIAGVTRLPVELIQRELRFKKGDLWNQKKLESSVARLKSLGIFEGVTVRPAPIDNPADAHEMIMQDVVLTCIDDDPFEVRARGGMQCIGQYLQMNALGARYGGSLVWKNPTNRADRLQVAIDVSPHVRYGDVTYTLPSFFSLPLTTTYSLYSSRFDEALMNCFKNKLYRLTQDGCSCEFEYAIDSKKAGCCFGFESMKVSRLSDELARLIDFSPQLVDERIPYWYFEPVIIITNLDDIMNPSFGTVTTLAAKGMVPLHTHGGGFFKILWEESLYLPIWQRLIGAFHLRAGHIFYTVFSRIMPSERFYLGGAYSLRGYDTDMAPPVNNCESRFVSGCLLPIGGKTVLSAMCEIRFPLYKALGGVLFTDCGVLVRDTLWEDSIVGATGFGLRYATPVGALRFDIAWKWRRQEGEKHRFSWFLTLGQAF